MKTKMTLMASVVYLLSASSGWAASFTLHSADIADGRSLTYDQVYQGFGCSGTNVSPQLSWSDAPKGTEAFAVFVYDPDAPTGSGWWHWQLVNIPKDVMSLAAGAGNINQALIPAGSRQMSNDFGEKAFGGACPPAGSAIHRYRFTVFALSQKLDLPANASAAFTGYMVHANSLASSTIEATYQRN